MKGLYKEIFPEGDSLSCIKRRGAFEQIEVQPNCLVSIMLTVKKLQVWWIIGEILRESVHFEHLQFRFSKKSYLRH